MNTLKFEAEKLLDKAGIKINGTNPYDIQVHNKDLYGRVLKEGSLGLGESYMDRWWDVERLDLFIAKVFTEKIDEAVTPLSLIKKQFLSVLFNYQTKLKSKNAIRAHYDHPPQFYELFLDPYNQYTCGYFKDTQDLNTAQIQKLDLICRKLGLHKQSGLFVLDIGCGWGGFAKYAAQTYGAFVKGISISKEQIAYAKNYTKGLTVTIEEIDYRDLLNAYGPHSVDRAVCIGMIEHVGWKNYQTIINIVHKLLIDDGSFLLHTIIGNESVTHGDPWLDKYIFPNYMLPSMPQLEKAFKGNFIVQDRHTFGQYYYHTLMAWHKNFVAKWDAIKTIKAEYDDRFYRMWMYYLLSCAGAFLSSETDLCQFVLTKKEVSGYVPVR